MINNFKKFPELYDEEMEPFLEDDKLMFNRQFEFTMMFQKLGERCVTKTIIGSVMGAGMGIFFGMLSGSLPSATHNQIMSPVTGGEMFREMITGIGSKCYRMAKAFAGISFFFGGIECVLSKARGRTDKLNNLAAGCITGFGLGIRGGPMAGLTGCLGFAAFGLVIDFFLLVVFLLKFEFSDR